MELTSMPSAIWFVSLSISTFCKIRIFAVNHEVGGKNRQDFALKSESFLMYCVKNFQILYTFKYYQLFTFICMTLVEVEQVH